MNPENVIVGGGVGGGGSYRNTPDNLRSTDTYELLLGIAGVHTKLAPGGLKNLFVDDVPVEDGQGNAVFKDFSATLNPGDPTTLTPVNLRMGQSGGQTSVGIAIANTYASGPGDWVTAAITQTNADFVDLRFLVQQLYRQTEDGVFEAAAHLEIQMRPSGTTNWINPLLDISAPPYNPNGNPFGEVLVYTLWGAYNPNNSSQWNEPSPGQLVIRGKTTSTHVKELRLAVPKTGAYANKTWEVRVRLIQKDYIVSGDDGENEERRTITWESIAPVSTRKIGDTEGWRGLSWLQIYGKASNQISGLPNVTGIYDLGLYNVPPNSVWNPSTRTYSGATWDGVTTQRVWTDCPAWQIKTLIEDGVSGISALSPGSTLNKWDVLEASKWFATQVSDGKGGTHPRYSANWLIDKPMQAHELVNYLAGAVGAHCWDEGDGRWRMRVERPETPQIIFTKEMIQGEFVYSHTDFDSRFNDYTGVFVNSENRYEEDRVRVWDQTDIDLSGRRHTTIALVGCSNRQEALRRLKIRLLTSLNETRIVTFTTNRIAALLEPLSVIAVADTDLSSNTDLRTTGRVVGINPARTQITLRDPVRLETGITYSVKFTVPNPDYNPEPTSQPVASSWLKPTITITRGVTNTTRGNVTVLQLDGAVPANLPEFAPVALEAVGLPTLPKPYRVTNIQISEDGKDFTVTAAEIYSPKWAESDVVSEEELHAQTVSRVVPPPTMPVTGMFDVREIQTPTGKQRVLTVMWDRPASMFVNDYRVEYSYNYGPWQQAGSTRDTYFELNNPLQGSYQFRIYMRDRRGVESLPLVNRVEVSKSSWTSPIAQLTNPATVLAAASDGTVDSYASATGRFEIRFNNGPITGDVTYSVVSTTGGLSVTIDEDTGEYSVVSLSTNSGSAVFRAVYDGINYDLIYTVSKSVQGASVRYVSLVASHSTVGYDSLGNVKPQLTTFDAQVFNDDDASLRWTLMGDGVALATNVTAAQLQATGFFTRVNDRRLTQTGAQFNAMAVNSYTLTVAFFDDPTIYYTVSVTKIRDGADGADGAFDQDTLDRIDGAIDDLIETYGTTASAASSAAAAAAARDLALGARDDAFIAVGAAEGARDEAITQASAASGSAGVAAGHASTATTKADAASGSASAAAGSASVASTKAGEALTSASNAATSEATAEGYKNAAAASAGVAASASSVAQNALIFDPPNEIREDLMTYRYYTKSPQEAEGLTPGSVVAGVYTMDAANLNKSLAFKKVFPWVQGRIYEVSAVVELTNMGGHAALSALAHLGRMNADYTSLSEVYYVETRKPTPLGEKVLITARYGCGLPGVAGVLNVAECPHFRLSVLTGRGAAGNAPLAGAFAKYHSFSVRDVTEQVAVELQAREGRLSQAKRAQYFLDGTDGWGELYTSAANKIATQVPELVTNYEGAARVLKSANGRWNIVSFETYPILPGRKYRLRHRFFIGGSPATTQTYTGFVLLDAAGGFDSYRYTGSAVLGAGWHERDAVVDCDVILAARPNAAQARLLAFHNYGAAVGTETAVAYLTIDDVTDAETAKTAASAAQLAESNASASASTAGSHAATATTQAGIATTKAGEASTYAGSAAISEETAEGHKTAAASSAILSANAKDVAVAAARVPLPSAVSPQVLSNGSVFGTPATRPPINAANLVDGVYTTADTGITTIEVLPWVAGRIYELTAVVEGIDIANRSFCYFERLNPDYSRLSTGSAAGTAQAVHNLDGVKKTVVVRAGCGVIPSGSGITGWNIAECQHFRMSVLLNRSLSTSSGEPGARTKLYSYIIKDVTEAATAQTAATAAQSSASSAEAHATTAGSHASTASSQAGIATTKAGEASTFSSNAASSASSAEGFANAASMSAGVAASVGQGALNKNAGFDTYPSATVGALPTGWAVWGTASPYRVADPQGGYAARIPAAAGATVGILQNLTPEQLLTENGYYVLEADVVLHSGTFAGSGVVLTPYNQSNATLTSLRLNFNNEPDVTGAVQSAPVTGRAYSFRKLVQIAGANPKGFILYACTNNAALNGGNAAAGDIEWRKCMVRPATAAEIRDQTVLEPMRASVVNSADAIVSINSTLASQSSTLSAQGITISSQTSAISTLQGELAVVAAKWGIQIDANGRIIGRIRLDGTASASLFEVMASVFRVVNPSGGAGMTWADGILWNRGSTHSVILGQNFGSNSDLMFWAGPNPSSAAAATKGNGIFWIDRLGNAYFGGSLSAGVLKNSATSTTLSKSSEVIIGPFATNGNLKSITCSYYYFYQYASGGDTASYNHPMSATIQIHRSINGGAWTLVNTLTASGTFIQTGSTGYGYTQYYYNIGGANTFNDNTAATGNLRFRATLIDFKVNGVTHNFDRPNGSSQSLSLTSIEE